MSESKRSPDPIDIHVGNRVRVRRILIGMGQEKLGEELGLTFQQIQKYEKGANRIGASRLYRISRILNVPVQFFFEDIPGEGEAPKPPSDENLRIAAEIDAFPPELQPVARRSVREVLRGHREMTRYDW